MAVELVLERVKRVKLAAVPGLSAAECGLVAAPLVLPHTEGVTSVPPCRQLGRRTEEATPLKAAEGGEGGSVVSLSVKCESDGPALPWHFGAFQQFLVPG